MHAVIDGTFPTATVRYAGPTNTRGSRWIATMHDDRMPNGRVSVTVGYDHALNPSGNVHAAAWAVWSRFVDVLAGRAADETDENLARIMRDHAQELADPAARVVVVGDLDVSRYVVTYVPTWAVPGR